MTRKTKRKVIPYIILGFVLIFGLLVFSFMVRNNKISHNSRASYSSPTPTRARCVQNTNIVIQVFPNASVDAYANLKKNNKYEALPSDDYAHVEQENNNDTAKNLTYSQGDLYKNTFWWFESKSGNALRQGKQEFILPVILNLNLPKNNLDIFKGSTISIYVDCGNGTNILDTNSVNNKDELPTKIWFSEKNIPVCIYALPGVYSLKAVFTLESPYNSKSPCVESYSPSFTFEIK